MYWQRIEYGYNIVIDGKENDKISGVLIYSDNLMEKFLEFNDVDGLDLNSDVAIILTEEELGSVTEIDLCAKEEIFGRYADYNFRGIFYIKDYY